MKKIALVILPALMVLAGCGVRPTANNKMIEDTLAHEEVFGSVSEVVSAERKLQPKKAVGVDKPYTPVIGFQRKTNDDHTFSVRFFATVESLDVEAFWTRSVHDVGGSTTNGKTRGTKQVKSVYQALNSDSGAISAADVVEEDDDSGAKPFQYFAVYCLLNIPENLSGYYVDAFLTVSYSPEGEKNYSPVGSLNVSDSSKHYKYSLQNNNRDALFVNGTEFLRNGSTSDKVSVEYATLHANDKMEVFYINETDLTLVRNSSITLGASFHDFTIDTDADIVTVKYSGKYHIYVNSSNEFWFKKKIYFNGFTNWDEWDNGHYDTYMQMQYVGSNTGSSTEFKMESTGNANEYFVFIDTTSYQNAQFHLSNNQKWTNFHGTNPLKNGENYYSVETSSWTTYVEE